MRFFELTIKAGPKGQDNENYTLFRTVELDVSDEARPGAIAMLIEEKARDFVKESIHGETHELKGVDRREINDEVRSDRKLEGEPSMAGDNELD